MNRPKKIIDNGMIKSQQSINHQNHISLTSTFFPMTPEASHISNSRNSSATSSPASPPLAISKLLSPRISATVFSGF